MKNVAKSISRDVRIKVFNEWIERLQIYIRKMETTATKRHFLFLARESIGNPSPRIMIIMKQPIIITR
jgi:hypothetical protein